MGCEEIRDMLAMFAAGEANDSERIAVESHLPMCAECRCEAEKYRDARASLGALRDGDAPSGTFERMWRGVRDAVLPPRVSRFSFDWVIRAAAVLVIGVAIGYVVSAQSARAATPAPASPVAVDAKPVSDPAPEAPKSGITRPADGSGGLTFDGGARPRLKSPRLKLDGNHYLPRVEAILPAEEVDW
jgi:anti-sigma factor RsiW